MQGGRLNIVLHEPEIPQNTGNIARTCAATGASLHIIRPMGFTVDDRRLKRAGLDYWHMLDIKYYDDFEGFSRQNAGEMYFFSTKAQKTYSDVIFPKKVFLVFGKETAGLPEHLLRAHPGRCLRIPMAGEARSLNLSNSVAVAVYETLRQWGFPGLAAAGVPGAANSCQEG